MDGLPSGFPLYKPTPTRETGVTDRSMPSCKGVEELLEMFLPIGLERSEGLGLGNASDISGSHCRG